MMIHSPFDRNLLPAGLFIALTLFVPQFVSGQNSCDHPENLTAKTIQREVLERDNFGCFGRDSDRTQSDATLSVARLTEKGDLKGQARYEGITKTLQIIVLALGKNLEEHGQPAQLVFGIMAAELAEDLLNLRLNVGYQAAERWVVENGNDLIPADSATYRVNLHRDLQYGERCKQVEGCNAAYQEAADALRLANLIHRVFLYQYQPYLSKTRGRLQTLAIYWDDYFNKARSQYPWELAVNDLRYNPPVDKFVEPPRDQIILLHPGLGVEYVQDAEVNRFQPVLVVELIGYNFWRWTDRGMGTSLGASAVMNLSDHPGYDTLSWGGVIHINQQYSFGVTHSTGPSGGATRVFMSMNVADLVPSKSVKLHKIYDELKDLLRW